MSSIQFPLDEDSKIFLRQLIENESQDWTWLPIAAGAAGAVAVTATGIKAWQNRKSCDAE